MEKNKQAGLLFAFFNAIFCAATKKRLTLVRKVSF